MVGSEWSCLESIEFIGKSQPGNFLIPPDIPLEKGGDK
jgi:hypothetical protein